MWDPPSLWSIHPLLLPTHGCVQPCSQDTFPDYPSQILPKFHQGGRSKPFSMIPQPLAGPGVELRDGTWGKGWQFQGFADQRGCQGKRGGKKLGNPFFLPKSKPQDTLRATLCPENPNPQLFPDSSVFQGNKLTKGRQDDPFNLALTKKKKKDKNKKPPQSRCELLPGSKNSHHFPNP